MAIAPHRLNGIATHGIQASELEGLGGKGLVRAFVEGSHDVAFADAAGARARPAQCFDGNEAFPAVIPFDGQFRADLLKIDRSHLNLKRRQTTDGHG